MLMTHDVKLVRDTSLKYFGLTYSAYIPKPNGLISLSWGFKPSAQANPASDANAKLDKRLWSMP